MEEEEKYYRKFAFKGSLSLEGYKDDMHWHHVIDKEKDDIIHNYFVSKTYDYNELKKLSPNERINVYKKEYEKMNKIFDYLGRNHFTFYDDGCVEYNYDIYKRQ